MQVKGAGFGDNGDKKIGEQCKDLILNGKRPELKGGEGSFSIFDNMFGEYAEMVENIEKINKAIENGDCLIDEREYRGSECVYYVDADGDNVADSIVLKNKDGSFSYDTNSDGRFEYSVEKRGDKERGIVTRYYDHSISTRKATLKTIESEQGFVVDWKNDGKYDYVQMEKDEN